MTDRNDATRAPAPAPIPLPQRPASRSTGGRSEPLTLAGMWFVVAGLGVMAPVIAAMLPQRFPESGSSGYVAYAPMVLGTILSFGAVVVGSVAAYVVLTRAGFPRRSRAMATVTISLAVVSPLIAFARFSYLLGDSSWTAAQVVSVIGAALLLVFAISAARNRVLPLGFRILPAVQFLLAVIAFVVSHSTFFPVGGIAFLAVGAAYIVLASHARGALEAAAVATSAERTGPLGQASASPDLGQIR